MPVSQIIHLFWLNNINNTSDIAQVNFDPLIMISLFFSTLLIPVRDGGRGFCPQIVKVFWSFVVFKPILEQK